MVNGRDEQRTGKASMKRIYYGVFEVERTEAAVLPLPAHAINAFMWVNAGSRFEATQLTYFEIERSGFRIIDIVLPLEAVVEERFAGKDIGTKAYSDAALHGQALIFMGVADDGVTTAGPLPLEHKQDSKLSEFYDILSEERNKGRCLHFASGHRCSSIINAHSAQRSGFLSLIQEDEHVYAPSFSLRTQKANNGYPDYQRISIKKFSTFLGFCGTHDSELFRPIDIKPLLPTREQVALYAYRSLCREFFVKENSLQACKRFLEKERSNPAIRKLLEGLTAGTAIGLNNLMIHKALYDEMLSAETFDRVNFVLFCSESAPNAAFSSVLYPDRDFQGNSLQAVGLQKEILRLITFCSAPLQTGWGFLIAWMKENNDVCIPFVDSIKTAMNDGAALGDLLFRLMIRSENHAVSPTWWKSLEAVRKQELLERIKNEGDLFIRADRSVLAEGVESISGWEFSSVNEVIE